MDSYRCYCIWVWDSWAARTCDTITWFPTKIVMPLASTAHLVLAGFTNIEQALHLPPNHVAVLKQLIGVLVSVKVLDLESPSNPEPIAPVRVDDHHPTNSSIGETAPPLRGATPTPLVSERKEVHFAPPPIGNEATYLHQFYRYSRSTALLSTTQTTTLLKLSHYSPQKAH
jgi:hypothetical protein